MSKLLDTLKSLETAEDFLDHFAIAYEQRVVDVNRLHILQRLHDLLAGADPERIDDHQLHETMSRYLRRAYQDFVESDARTEKAFKVFQRTGESSDRLGRTTIPLANIRGIALSDKP